MMENANKKRPKFGRNLSLQSSSDSSACAPETLVTPRAAGGGREGPVRGVLGTVVGSMFRPAQKLKGLRRRICFCRALIFCGKIMEKTHPNPPHVNINHISMLDEQKYRRFRLPLLRQVLGLQ